MPWQRQGVGRRLASFAAAAAIVLCGLIGYVRLHSPEVGDIVTVPNVGAYGVTASLLLFLSRPAPHEVVLRNGEVLTVSQLQVRRNAERVLSTVTTPQLNGQL